MSDSKHLDMNRHDPEFADRQEAWEATGCLPETHATETELEKVLARKNRELLELVKSA